MLYYGYQNFKFYGRPERKRIAMKFLKQHANSLLLCLFEILVGTLLLINPAKFTVAILTAFGAVLIATGIISVLSYFGSDPVEAASSQSLFKGLLALVAGIFCVARSDWFIVAFPVLAVLYGVVVLIVGLFKVQWTVDLIRMKLGRWGLPAASAVVSLICSVVILGNPFGAAVALWIFTGVSLIVEAVLDIISIFMISAASGRSE